MQTVTQSIGILSEEEIPKQVARRSDQDARTSRLYGTFFLNGEEFPLRVADIREVVKYPANVSRVPLSPCYLEGVFNLRGDIVPIVNLKVVLNASDTGFDRDTSRVAIIDYGGVYVGVVFDRTGEIVTIDPEDIAAVRHNRGARNEVVQGVAKLDGGDRILQILSPELIVGIEELPRVDNSGDHGASRGSLLRARRVQNLSKAISFFVDDMEFAIDIERVLEIQDNATLSTSHAYYENCLGVLNLRGKLVTVLDFRAAMGGEPTAELAAKKLIIVTVSGFRCGLVVDRISEVVTFAKEDVAPIPALKAYDVRKCFFGFICKDESRQILYIDVAAFLADRAIREAIEANAKVSGSVGASGSGIHGTADSAEVDGDRERVYITYRLGSSLAVEILQIQEVIDFPDRLLEPPGCHGCIIGILKLRDTIVPVANLRTYYGMSPFPDLATTKVIIIGRGTDRYGFVVDAVEDIVKIRPNAAIGLPKMLKDEANGQLHGDVVSAYQVPGRDGRDNVVLVHNLAKVLERIAGGTAEL